ncbi:hypothetical protein M885DRAFT_619932, partial [Pelagophyceae sp. CCMP2097]
RLRPVRVFAAASRLSGRADAAPLRVSLGGVARRGVCRARAATSPRTAAQARLGAGFCPVAIGNGRRGAAAQLGV